MFFTLAYKSFLHPASSCVLQILIIPLASGTALQDKLEWIKGSFIYLLTYLYISIYSFFNLATGLLFLALIWNEMKTYVAAIIVLEPYELLRHAVLTVLNYSSTQFFFFLVISQWFFLNTQHCLASGLKSNSVHFSLRVLSRKINKLLKGKYNLNISPISIKLVWHSPLFCTGTYTENIHHN